MELATAMDEARLALRPRMVLVRARNAGCRVATSKVLLPMVRVAANAMAVLGLPMGCMA